MKHQVDHRDVDHGFTAGWQGFVVLAEPTIPAEPTECTLDNPTLGQHDELVGVAAFDDLDDTAKHPLGFMDKPAGVPAIGPDEFEPCETPGHRRQHLVATVAVLDVCGMNDDREDQAEGIDTDMPFSTDNLLPRVVAVRPPLRGASVLTDCESRMPADGVGFLPALRRTFSRSLS